MNNNDALLIEWTAEAAPSFREIVKKYEATATEETQPDGSIRFTVTAKDKAIFLAMGMECARLPRDSFKLIRHE